MIFIDETKAKYFFNSLDNCNSNYDFFNAGVNYVLQELAKKEVEKENNRNCVFDSYKTQFNSKKLAYWLKCHSNFYAMFETFKNDNLNNCVSKIKLVDDKNNMLVLMCLTSETYSSYLDNDNYNHNDFMSKTIFIND